MQFIFLLNLLSAPYLYPVSVSLIDLLYFSMYS
jgi:hypothetical protein